MKANETAHAQDFCHLRLLCLFLLLLLFAYDMVSLCEPNEIRRRHLKFLFTHRTTATALFDDARRGQTNSGTQRCSPLASCGCQCYKSCARTDRHAVASEAVFVRITMHFRAGDDSSSARALDLCGTGEDNFTHADNPKRVRKRMTRHAFTLQCNKRRVFAMHSRLRARDGDQRDILVRRLVSILLRILNKFAYRGGTRVEGVRPSFGASCAITADVAIKLGQSLRSESNQCTQTLLQYSAWILDSS